jgi:hypothetical protein
VAADALPVAPFTMRETVAIETPAARATSAIEAGFAPRDLVLSGIGHLANPKRDDYTALGKRFPRALLSALKPENTKGGTDAHRATSGRRLRCGGSRHGEPDRP